MPTTRSRWRSGCRSRLRSPPASSAFCSERRVRRQSSTPRCALRRFRRMHRAAVSRQRAAPRLAGAAGAPGRHEVAVRNATLGSDPVVARSTISRTMVEADQADRAPAEFLRRFAPFNGLPEPELERAAAAAQVRSYAAGAAILSEDGAPSEGLYVVRSGTVELRHEEETIDVLEPGEAFGHPSLLSGMAPAFDVHARDDDRLPPHPVGRSPGRARRARRACSSWPARFESGSSAPATSPTPRPSSAPPIWARSSTGRSWSARPRRAPRRPRG